jgi:hypothetical protein
MDNDSGRCGKREIVMGLSDQKDCGSKAVKGRMESGRPKPDEPGTRYVNDLTGVGRQDRYRNSHGGVKGALVANRTPTGNNHFLGNLDTRFPLLAARDGS